MSGDDKMLDTMDRLINKMEDIAGKLTKMENELESKIFKLEDQLNSRLDKVDSRLDKVESDLKSGFARAEDRFAKLEDDLNTVHCSVVNIELTQFPRIAASLDGVSSALQHNKKQDERLDVVEDKVEAHDLDIHILKQKVS